MNVKEIEEGLRADDVMFTFVSSRKYAFTYRAEWNNMVITLRVLDYRYEFEPTEYATIILDADDVDISVSVVNGESA